MEATLCLRLPFLRGPLPRGLDPDASSAPAWPGALRLWPGLPDALCIGDAPADAAAGPNPARYRPVDYPFSQREAAACLADLRQMDAAALSGLPLGAAVAGNARNARQLAELAALQELDGRNGPAPAAAESARRERLGREQAQKALLWLWLQEERLAELADLARRYADNAGRLTAALGVEEDESPRLLPFGGASIALDPALVPPWRLAAVNAAHFLPGDAAVAAEGPMRADLLERLDFSPAPHYAALLGCPEERAGEIVRARAPLWRALGHSRAPGRDADGPLSVERVWLTWRRA